MRGCFFRWRVGCAQEWLGSENSFDLVLSIETSHLGGILDISCAWMSVEGLRGATVFLYKGEAPNTSNHAKRNGTTLMSTNLGPQT